MAQSLTIVIPFYKDEVYLDDALASTEYQGVADLEVVVVNDNPSAASDAFLAALQTRRDFRIARHDENRGLAAARNTGIAAATKDYVAFLDADDIFITGALGPALAFADEGESDMTHLPTLVTHMVGHHPVPLHRDSQLFGARRRNVALKDAPEAQYIVSSWCSIYRRAFLDERQVRFDEAQRRYEDRLFVLEAITRARTISFWDQPGRVWRRRMGSITTTEKDRSGLAMQCALIVKCLGVARAYAEAAPGREMVLQRELFNSVSRLIWDVGVLDHDPAATPDLDETRAALSGAISAEALSKKVFSDKKSYLISRIGQPLRHRKTVTRRDFRRVRDMVAAGDWAAAHAWRKGRDALPAAPKAKPLEMELILHLGLHKTGSTHIQRSLEAGRAALKAEGVLFPETGFVESVADNLRSGATPGHAGIMAAIRRADMGVMRALHRECAASGCDKVLISSENMSFPLDEARQRADLMRVAARAFAFLPRRRVVAVIRRPDEYIERYYRELVGLAASWARRTPEQFAFEVAPAMTDLDNMLGPWADWAGGEMRLVGYDRARKEGLMAAFCDAAGIAVPEADKTAAADTYVSPRADQTLAARAIAQARMTDPRRKAAVGLFFAETASMAAGRDRSLFSLATRRRLIDDFERNSADFLARFGAGAPIADWRASLDAEADEPPLREAPAALIGEALKAMELTVDPPEKYRVEWSRHVYRLGKRFAGRFF